MLNFSAVGLRIRKIRSDKGITQEELAFRLHTSASYISNIERGVKKPSLQKLSDIADVLHVTVNDLLYDKTDIQYSSNEDELLRLLSFWEPKKRARLKNNLTNLLEIIIEE